MATEMTVGRVEYLKVATDYGFVNIRVETPTGISVPPVPHGLTNELFIIWYGHESRCPRDLVVRELSNALTSGLRVRVSHDDDSAFITELIVDAPFEGALV